MPPINSWIAEKKKLGLFLLLGGLVVILAGIEIHPPEKTPTTAEVFYLTPEQRTCLEKLVIEKSDAHSAFGLGMYYEASVVDLKQAAKWFKIAEKLGDERAPSHLRAIAALGVEVTSEADLRSDDPQTSPVK